MDADEVLTTTRAVRRRLDPSRPVPLELIRDCIDVALQAPAGSNLPRTRFVVVRDPVLRKGLADLYTEVYEGTYRESEGYIGKVATDDASGARTQERSARSADALASALHEVDTIVITCLEGARLDGASAMANASLLGGVLPATWSFMLAARARGLGTCWTTMHMARERDAAELLGIPFDRVQQVCLTPVAFTTGEKFGRARRPAVDDVLHLDGWDASLPSVPDVRGLAAR